MARRPARDVVLVDVAEVVVDVDEGALDVGDGLDALLEVEREVVRDLGSKRERNSPLQRLLARPVPTRFG